MHWLISGAGGVERGQKPRLVFKSCNSVNAL